MNRPVRPGSAPYVRSPALPPGAFAVAAEYAAVVTDVSGTAGPGRPAPEAGFRLVPGGLVHAVDLGRGELACSAASEGLAFFGAAWPADAGWGRLCPLCQLAVEAS